jgi:hypothetical protein
MLFLKPLFGFAASTSALTVLMVLLGHAGCGAAPRSSPVHPLSGTITGIEHLAFDYGACRA